MIIFSGGIDRLYTSKSDVCWRQILTYKGGPHAERGFKLLGNSDERRSLQNKITVIFVWDTKWNESGFRPPLCTYKLNWARTTSWGWWDDWDDTALQTQDSKFEPWRSEAEHATSRSRRLPTILTFTRELGRNIFVSFKPQSPGTEPWTLAWKAALFLNDPRSYYLPNVQVQPRSHSVNYKQYNSNREIFVSDSSEQYYNILRHSNKIQNWKTFILNCQGLRVEVEAFQWSVDYFQSDCIIGTESWLDISDSTNEIFPLGYKIFRRERITSTQGGGVFIAVKEHYDVSLLPDTVTDTELLWAKAHFEKSKSLILGSFYRRPGSKIEKNGRIQQIFRSSSKKLKPNHHPAVRTSFV